MREADIRPADLLNEYLRLSAADIGNFFPDRTTFVHRPCPGCGAESATAAFEKGVFSLVRCDACRTLYADPIPRTDLLDAFYRDSTSQRYWGNVFFPAVAEARRQKIFRPRVDRIESLLGRRDDDTGIVVDVGAGTGIFLEECRSAGWRGRLIAVEPSSNLATDCRAKGFETFQGLASEAAAAAPWCGAADLAVSFEVIEHVPSADAFISDLAALVRPGGHILITGLCGTGFDILALGARSKAVSPPHHLNFLSRAGIESLFRRCGLELVVFQTPGQLDLDIVRNTLAETGERPDHPFLDHLLSDASEAARVSFQTFLATNELSSHLWAVGRRT